MMAEVFCGVAASPGYALGPAFHYVPYEPSVSPSIIENRQSQENIGYYSAAREAAREELETLRRRVDKSDPERGKILAAHQSILMDAVLDEEIRDRVLSDLWGADWAIWESYGAYIRRMEGASDPLLRERAADLRDVRDRLLRCLEGQSSKELSLMDTPVVLVTRDLRPSDAAVLDRQKVLAIITETGGATCHSAILARSSGIPAVLGVENALALLPAGEEVLVDGTEGRVVLQPDESQREEFRRSQRLFASRVQENARFLAFPAITADGERVKIHLNLGTGQLKPPEVNHVDGAGLLRTEFLYLEREDLPSEEEQLSAYRQVLETFGGKEVTVRTLDIGGDKQLPYLELPREENPFLGSRALRLCFDHPDLLKTQLRACLRAGVYGSLRLMFPMVSGVDDLRRAKRMLTQCRLELEREGIACAEDFPVGIMVELPSAAIMADLIAEEADFASIGTNDLTQYVLAADRMNPAVRQYYRPFHPAVLRLIAQVSRSFGKKGKPVCVCGEMAGDPLGAAVLVGLDIRQLSMNSASVAPVKRALSLLDTREAREAAQAVCSMATGEEAELYLRKRFAYLL